MRVRAGVGERNGRGIRSIIHTPEGGAMADERLLAGVSSRTVDTPRLRTHLLESGPGDGEPVLFVPGNASSGRFFEETLAALPGHRGLAPDLRGFGGSETRPLDATRGVADFSGDLRALVEGLGPAGGAPPPCGGAAARAPGRSTPPGVSRTSRTTCARSSRPSASPGASSTSSAGRRAGRGGCGTWPATAR